MAPCTNDVLARIGLAVLDTIGDPSAAALVMGFNDEHTLNQLDAQAETGRMHERHRQHVIRHGHTNAIPKRYNAHTGRRDRPRNKLRKHQTRAA